MNGEGGVGGEEIKYSLLIGESIRFQAEMLLIFVDEEIPIALRRKIYIR